jgi:hypothetical protein
MFIMHNDIGMIREFFGRIGLEPEVADIYIALHTYGAQTISELSRNSSVERTKIYRLIEDLAAANLVEVEVQYKRSILKAAPLSNLQILLTKKEEELVSLHAEMGLIQDLLRHQSESGSPTKVQFYKGREGLKQMMWNETRGKGENLSILYENMQGRTNRPFFERWVRLCNERGLRFRGLIGEHFLETQNSWYARNDTEKLAYWESRQVPKGLFTISHNMVIYNDVVAYYNWNDENVFGVELYNKDIALAQKQFFEMLWKQSKPVSKAVSQPRSGKKQA